MSSLSQSTQRTADISNNDLWEVIHSYFKNIKEGDKIERNYYFTTSL